MKRRDALPTGAAAGMQQRGGRLGLAATNPHAVGLTPASKTRLT
jgi:hypothetical protein